MFILRDKEASVGQALILDGRRYRRGRDCNLLIDVQEDLDSGHQQLHLAFDDGHLVLTTLPRLQVHWAM